MVKSLKKVIEFKNFILNKKKYLLLSLVCLLSIIILSAWSENYYLAKVSDLLKYDQKYSVMWKWEITLNFIAELKTWNESIFDIFDLDYHAFSEIVEEEVVVFDKNIVKFKFYATTRWDSLHEYYYTLHFDDKARLIWVVEG